MTLLFYVNQVSGPVASELSIINNETNRTNFAWNAGEGGGVAECLGNCADVLSVIPLSLHLVRLWKKYLL